MCFHSKVEYCCWEKQSHTSIRTRETIISFEWTTLPHPPYSPDYHLFSLMKEGLKGKHYVSDEEVKTAVIKWLKEQSIILRQRYVLSFKGGILLLRETVTMLMSRDVVNRGPASFWCVIHVPSICRCLPPDTTWHKVKSPKAN